MPDIERAFLQLKHCLHFRCVIVAAGEKRYIRLRDAHPRYVPLLGIDQRRRSRGRVGRFRRDPCERDTLHRRVRREFIERRGHCREYHILFTLHYPAHHGICCVGGMQRAAEFYVLLLQIVEGLRYVERRRLKPINPSRASLRI